MSNLVIVAIPAEDDPVWRISSEKVPHLTLLFLGEDPDTVAKTGQIADFLGHAARTSLTRFSLEVDHRGTLGKDEADVVFFAGWDLPDLVQFRGYLLQDSNIAKAYLAADQFPHWQPHLTLGYPETPAAKPIDIYDRVTWVRFDKVALWTDDFDGPTFELKSPDPYFQDMAVSMSTAVDDILAHHGVKGMKWGVTRSKIASGVKAAARFGGDVVFENDASSEEVRDTITDNAGQKWMTHDLPAIRKKPEYQKAAKLKNRLLHPKDPATKAYRNEVKTAFRKRLEEEANTHRNASGDRMYTIDDGGINGNSSWQWEVRTTAAKHADSVTTIKIRPIMDNDGFITGFEPIHNTIKQGEDFIDALSHHGVKGMKWGRRRASGPVAVTTVANKKGVIKTVGGKNHPTHADAIPAKVAIQKAKKSGISSLSDQELQTITKRLNLEQQVSNLGKSDLMNTGERFVTMLLDESNRGGKKR